MKRTLAAGGIVLALMFTASLWRAQATAHAADRNKPAVTGKVKFNRDVRPILSEYCLECHGPDAAHRKKGLSLDIADVAKGKLPSGNVAIVPGDPEASELIKRINHPDPKKRMPHFSKNKTLTPEQKQTLRRWIEQGAEYEGHWSLITPKRPTPPRVAHADWAKTAIDQFIAARLELEGLKPSEEAARHELIRRVTFDLTGLPPTPAEVNAFVHDKAPNAYEKVVDRLLASPRYGEHMARHWLDYARYGDTHGLHLDNYREMWPYRDAVIHAFNDNMKWDRFTLASIAGDMLPDRTQREHILSGFLRCHITTHEGGVIDEEVYVRNVTDRTSTVGTVFLGLTAGCATCHDHKFDPLTMKDYYSMWAFFNNLDGPARDQNAKAFGPTVKVPMPGQAEQLAAHEKAIAEASTEAKRLLATVEYNEPNLPERDLRTIVWIDDAEPAGAKLVIGGANLAWSWVDKKDHPVASGNRSLRLEAKGLMQNVIEGVGKPLKIGAGDKLFANVFIDPANPPKQIMLQWNTSGWKHRAYWGANVIPWGKDKSTERMRLGDLPKAGEWVRLEVPAAVVGINPGDVIVGWAFTQHDGVAYWDASGIESAVPQEPEDSIWIGDKLPDGAKASGNPGWVTADGGKHPVHSGKRSMRASRGGGLNQHYFTGASPLVLKAGDKLFGHVYIDPKDPPKGVQFQFNNGSWEHRARWGTGTYAAGRGGAADFVASEKIPEVGKWVRLEVPIESVGLKPGDALNGWAFSQLGGTVYWDTAGVKTLDPADDRHLQSLSIWAQRAKTNATIPADVKQAAIGAPGGRTEAQQKRLHDYFVQWVWAGSRNDFDPINARIEAARKGIDAAKKSAATTLVMKERAGIREAFMLNRGLYDKRGDKVERATPAFLPPMADDLPRDRLGFAKWLIAPEHPLMARVTVNRYWQQLFGTGLVKTSEDLGSQGEYPSHPELLDWLAVDFREGGWDVKRLMKQLVMTATYRQSSKATQELIARDPENRLLARGSRYRLDAEQLRDQALAVSGLLVNKIGGPGVKPPQPLGLWLAVGYSGSNTVRFKSDAGSDKIHRRTIYTFLKRTAPAPQLDVMNAPNRESCVTRRERTNTPLQALLLLNDPQYVEAARVLGQRAIREGGTTTESRIDFLVRVCLGRNANAVERSAFVDAHNDHLSTFKADPAKAKRLIAIGSTKPDAAIDSAELASWTLVASTVLNMDEVLSKN